MGGWVVVFGVAVCQVVLEPRPAVPSTREEDFVFFQEATFPLVEENINVFIADLSDGNQRTLQIRFLKGVTVEASLRQQVLKGVRSSDGLSPGCWLRMSHFLQHVSNSNGFLCIHE